MTAAMIDEAFKKNADYTAGIAYEFESRHVAKLISSLVKTQMGAGYTPENVKLVGITGVGNGATLLFLFKGTHNQIDLNSSKVCKLMGHRPGTKINLDPHPLSAL